MLEKLRKGAASWVAKALIGLLILSFAVWGIADMISGRTSDTVATVGDRKITETEFRDAYQAQLAATSRQFGQQLNTEQARLFGVPQQTVQRLLSTAAVDEHARRLGLAVSSQSIVDAIRTDPTFQDATGNFSKPQFDQLLRDAGLNEPRYLVERGRQTVREQLTDSMIGAIPVPAELIATTHSFRTDARKVRYVVLDAATIAKPGEPTEAQITETYEQNKRRFVAPESRRVGVLLLSADAPKGAMQISDPDIDRWADAQQVELNPEKRRGLLRKIWDRDLDMMYRPPLVNQISFEVYPAWVRALRYDGLGANGFYYSLGDQISYVWLDK